MVPKHENLTNVTVAPFEKPLWWNKSASHSLERIIFIAPDSPTSKFGKITIFRMPPGPLLAIAAHTKQILGDSVHCAIVDEVVGDVLPTDIRPDKDLVAITAVTSNVNYAYARINQIKEKYGPVPVVFGGHHATHLPDETLCFADVVVRGESENVWPELLNDLKNGKLKQIYDGTKTTVDISGLDFPIPDISFLQQPQKYGTFIVYSSRGCINACPFCDMQAFFGKSFVRYRHIDNVAKEIESLPKRFTLSLADDNILNNRERAIELAKILGTSGTAWTCQTDIRIGDDPKLLDLFAKSGCIMCVIGFESIDKDAVKYVGKAKVNNPDNYERQIRNIKAAGINIYAELMFGLPGTRYPDTFEKTVEWLKKYNIDFAQMTVETPLPGTVLRDRMIKENRLLTRGSFGKPISWDDYDFLHVVSSPVGITPEQLQRGLHWAYYEFYGDTFWKSYISNFPNMLKSNWFDGWDSGGINLKSRILRTASSYLMFNSLVNTVKMHEMEINGRIEKVTSL